MASGALLNSFAPPPPLGGGAYDDYTLPAAPMRRFAVTVPLAMLTLIAMVAGSRFMPSSLPAPPHYDVVMATIVEPPPPPMPAGLQGGAAPVTKPVAKPVHHQPRHLAKPVLPPPTLATSPSGGISIPAPAAVPSAPKEDTSGIAGGTGVGTGAGVGNDSGGARAIYAPPPKIPDDLREDAIHAEAMAHFVVAPDGTVTVTLVKPTSNPRLNQVLLAALSQWQFFPAMRAGMPVPSEFDLRIPIVIE
jgi:periplasmic protein TonB